MSMTLHFGEREFILFDFWKTGSALALRIFLARAHNSNLAYERQQRRATSPCVQVRSPSENLDNISSDSVTFAPLLRISSAAAQVLTMYRVTQALLYAVQATLAYLLMLVVMTFNIWLLFAVIIGEAVGYFLFAGEPMLIEHLNDACC
uniref:Copper transport protein n=1 Tax=Ascaris lumbricoides TaxID=6252 RepID=A0A0M3IAS3_ASCLU